MRVEQTQLNGVTELNGDLPRHLNAVADSGIPTHVPKDGQDHVTVIPTELWHEILAVPGIKKRIRGHVRAKQAEKEARLGDAA